MFVGITRAQQELQISLARYRDFRGQRKLTIPSSFLMELPRAEMEIEFPECTCGQVANCPTEMPSISQTPPIAERGTMLDNAARRVRGRAVIRRAAGGNRRRCECRQRCR